MSAFGTNWREDFLAALTFLTRLPVARWSSHGEVADGSAAMTLAGASWAFPLVGIVVGLIGGIVYLVALALGLPVLAAAFLSLAATAIATGGLHEDGLADTADGLGGGSRDEKLAIMRDSGTGAYGALALIFGVGLRVAALDQIATAWQALGALIAAHALARGFLPAVLHGLEPARSDGLGADAGRPEQAVVFVAAGIAIVAALLAAGIRAGLAASVVTAVVVAILAWLARRQLGGYTGDVLGAIEQGAEIAALLAIASWSP